MLHRQILQNTFALGKCVCARARSLSQIDHSKFEHMLHFQTCKTKNTICCIRSIEVLSASIRGNHNCIEPTIMSKRKLKKWENFHSNEISLLSLAALPRISLTLPSAMVNDENEIYNCC